MIALAQSRPWHFEVALGPVPLSQFPCLAYLSILRIGNVEEEFENEKKSNGISNYLARRRFSSSSIEGGHTKMKIASSELALTDLAP